MSLFDPLGIFCNHFIMNFKTLFSKVCKKFPQSDYDLEIGSRDIELRNAIVENTKKLIMLDTNPMLSRAILQPNEKVTKVITSCDGSLEGYSSTVHFIIESEIGEKRSRIIRASNKVLDSTVPITELYSYHLAGTILTQVILCLKTFLTPNNFEILEYYILGDSQSTCLQLAFEPKQGTHLTLVKKVKRIYASLEKAMGLESDSKAKLNFGWVKSSLNPADINSKSTQDFNKSTMWINGPTMFLNSDKLQETVWANFRMGKFNLTKDWQHWNPSMYSQRVEKALKLPLGSKVTKSQTLAKAKLSKDSKTQRRNEANTMLKEAVEKKVNTHILISKDEIEQNQSAISSLDNKEDYFFTISTPNLRQPNSYSLQIKNPIRKFWFPNNQTTTPMSHDFYEYLIGKSNCFFSILAHFQES